MLEYCENQDMIDVIINQDYNTKAMAKGFWYLSWFVKEWTGNENFRKINPKTNEYYNVAYELIHGISL